MNLRKIKHLRLIILLISSNLFLTLAFYYGETEVSKPSPHHQIVLYPIDLYVPLERGKYLSLYDENDQLIIKKAQILSRETNDLHLLEINNTDLAKIISLGGKKLKGFPPLDPNQENLEFTF